MNIPSFTAQLSLGRTMQDYRAGTGGLIEGEERLILKEADIFGVIEGKMWAAARAA